MSKVKLRSPLTWVGGKSRLLDWLLPLLDTPCQSFVDVFGGSGSVLLNRTRVPVEVYNDLDGSLVTFMLCCRDHPAELQRLLAGTPYARSLHEAEVAWLKAGAPGRITDLHYAARWYWLNLAGFGGQLVHGFGTARGVDGRSSHVTKQHLRVGSIESASRRLRDVLIECDPWQTILDRYDHPAALFYCDPPYIGTEDMYSTSEGWGMAEHRALAGRLADIEGKAAISYFAHPALDELYPPPHWRRHRTTRLVTLGLTAGGKTPRETEELLLCNYGTEQQSRLAL